MSVERLCEGGELLDKILSRGGRYTEEDAKVIVVQILSVIAYCHLQGVVHCDLKPENFLFATREEDASVRVINFGLSDFIRPDNFRIPEAFPQQKMMSIPLMTNT